ncbi:hypothetical protein EG832_18925 [bacterium]|nr:hypothetical protein [bacterium]
MIRLILILLFAILMFSFPVSSSAELYLGIGPFDNLSDIKKKFPNATFTRENPAWAQDYDVMYTISGEGISGTIVILFHDSYAKWKKQIEAEQDEAKKRFMEGAPHPVENQEIISWVRWVPDQPFSITRLVTKYGKPEITGSSQDNFKPYKEWNKRGIQAHLTDDEKNVMRIDFTFTQKERDEAMKQKYGFALPKETKTKKMK